jgi:hypothetical protein
MYFFFKKKTHSFRFIQEKWGSAQPENAALARISREKPFLRRDVGFSLSRCPAKLRDAICR